VSSTSPEPQTTAAAEEFPPSLPLTQPKD